ncbi:MAG: putative DNA-binding domain-containing protein [Candidatus Sericytochromatia bacterium]
MNHAAFVESVVLGRPYPLSELRPVGRLSAAEALAVYQTDYHVRLGGALQESFSRLSHGLGEVLFGHLCAAFLAVHCSNSPDLNDFGENFPAWLAQRTDLLAASPLPASWWVQLAELEWQAQRLFFADPPPPVALTALLASAAPEDWGLQLTPHCRLFRSEAPLFALWCQTPPEPAQPPSALLLYKNQAGVHAAALSLEQAELVAGLRDGLSLGAALERVRTVDASLVSGVFALLSQAELIQGLRMP